MGLNSNNSNEFRSLFESLFESLLSLPLLWYTVTSIYDQLVPGSSPPLSAVADESHNCLYYTERQNNRTTEQQNNDGPQRIARR